MTPADQDAVRMASDAERLAKEAIEMAERATPGPWRVEAECGEDIGVVCTRYEDETPGVCASYSKDWPLEVCDAELIAHARTSLPILARALLLSEGRRKDLEMMLRAAFPDESEKVPFMSYGPGCDDELETVFYVHRNADDLDPIILDDDGTGLPILTPEARIALSGEGKEK
jgi:hypothetical protein